MRTLGCVLRILDRQEIRETLRRVLTEKMLGSLKDEIEARVNQILFRLSEMVVLGVVKHVGTAVGSEALEVTLSQLRASADSISYEMIDACVRLDHFRSFPEDDVLRLHDRVRKNALAQAALRDLVWLRFYLQNDSVEIRQRVCAQMNIEYREAAFLDRRVKRLRGRS